MKTIRLAYCDYIAHLIQKNLIDLDSENLLDAVGKIQFHLNEHEEFASTMKTIDVLDMQGKAYRITVQEL